MDQPKEIGDDKSTPLKWSGQPTTRSGRIERLKKNDRPSLRSKIQALRDRIMWYEIHAEQDRSPHPRLDIYTLKQQINQLEQQIRQLKKQIKQLTQKNNGSKERTDKYQQSGIFATTKVARHGGPEKDIDQATRMKPMSWKQVKTYS